MLNAATRVFLFYLEINQKAATKDFVSRNRNSDAGFGKISRIRRRFHGSKQKFKKSIS